MQMLRRRPPLGFSGSARGYQKSQLRISGPKNTMAERLSRQVLYDFVWSEPMKTLSTRFGISDVALKKTCARAGIPTPDRGYWAKKDARKDTFQAALPGRPPGMDDQVVIGSGGNGSYNHWNQEEPLAPIGAPPEFSEPIETVRARIAEIIGRVAVPHKVLNSGVTGGVTPFGLLHLRNSPPVSY
jgi:hypothetical protein